MLPAFEEVVVVVVNFAVDKMKDIKRKYLLMKQIQAGYIKIVEYLILSQFIHSFYVNFAIKEVAKRKSTDFTHQDESIETLR